MTISSLALAAKKVIDAAWLHGEAYDLSSQAAFALESTQMLQSPETAAEFESLRARVAELEAGLPAMQEALFKALDRVTELEAERHSTNESLSAAAEALHVSRDREAIVSEFAAKRAEYITAIRNCHPDNGHDYDRWQGHAAARRQLAELLGLPVAWPAEDDASVAKPADRLTALLAPTQAYRRDGGASC